NRTDWTHWLVTLDWSDARIGADVDVRSAHIGWIVRLGRGPSDGAQLYLEPSMRMGIEYDSRHVWPTYSIGLSGSFSFLPFVI
ncbi:MAG: hypothetical protein NUV56_02505, partial [Candidatus Uhrbacteria bacterium]|nr:hypothetical protein [Candidatus Uhrbacteria bacterium]